MLSVPHEVAPSTRRFPGFGLEDAYRVIEDVRSRWEARGERVVGRKIGFTNSAAWAGYGMACRMLKAPSMEFELSDGPNRAET